MKTGNTEDNKRTIRITQILFEFDSYDTKKYAINFVELEDITFDGKFDNTKKSEWF